MLIGFCSVLGSVTSVSPSLNVFLIFFLLLPSLLGPLLLSSLLLNPSYLPFRIRSPGSYSRKSSRTSMVLFSTFLSPSTAFSLSNSSSLSLLEISWGLFSALFCFLVYLIHSHGLTFHLKEYVTSIYFLYCFITYHYGMSIWQYH